MLRNVTARHAWVLLLLGLLAVAQLAPAAGSSGYVHAAGQPPHRSVPAQGKPGKGHQGDKTNGRKPGTSHSGGATQRHKPGKKAQPPRKGRPEHEGNPGSIKITPIGAYTTRNYPQISCNTPFYIVGLDFATRTGTIRILAKGPRGGFTVDVTNGPRRYSGQRDHRHRNRYDFISGPYTLSSNGEYKVFVSSGDRHYKTKVIHMRGCRRVTATATPTGTAAATTGATTTAIASPTATATGNMATSTATTGSTATSGTATAMGYVEICKAASGGLPDIGTRQYTFTITDQGVSVTRSILAGLCTEAIPIPAGTATIVEQASSGTTLVGVSVTPDGRLVSFDPGTRTAVVTIVAGDSSTETKATFTNAAAPTTTGTATTAPTSTSTSTVAPTSTGTATTAPTSTSTSTTAPTATGTSTPTSTSTSTTAPTATGTSTPTSTSTSTVAPTSTGTATTAPTATETGTTTGGVSRTATSTSTTAPTATTTSTATSAPTTAALKICKLVTTGPGGAPTPAAGQQFTFVVSLQNGNATTTTRVVTVANQCVQVGTAYPSGTGITIQEVIPDGYQVVDITDGNPNDQVQSVDRPNGTIVLVLGGGTSNVTYTNQTMGPAATPTATTTTAPTATGTARATSAPTATGTMRATSLPSPTATRCKEDHHKGDDCD